MDTNLILAELRAERQRLDQAITALESLNHAGASTPRTASPKRRHMSAAGRKAISDAAKAMWAEKKKNARPRRHMSAATRKRLSQLAKQRWAERKKKAKTA
jgi:hypothetical protein